MEMEMGNHRFPSMPKVVSAVVAFTDGAFCARQVFRAGWDRYNGQFRKRYWEYHAHSVGMSNMFHKGYMAQWDWERRRAQRIEVGV